MSGPDNIPPCRSPHAAGYDLYSVEAKRIPAQGRALIDTQLLIAVPPETYGRIAPHSGLASKFSIDVSTGIIDSDYHGIIYVLLINHGDQDFEVHAGNHIAQLILERVSTPLIMEAWDLNDLPSTPNASIAVPGDLE